MLAGTTIPDKSAPHPNPLPRAFASAARESQRAGKFAAPLCLTVNMNELTFNAENSVWRVAYAFAPTRRAILLVAGNKAGVRRGGSTML